MTIFLAKLKIIDELLLISNFLIPRFRIFTNAILRKQTDRELYFPRF